MAVVYMNPERDIVAQGQYPTGSDFTWKMAEEGIRHFLSANPLSGQKIVGVGIAIPGLIQDDKVFKTIDIPLLEGWDPKDMPEFSGIPIRILHDGRAAGFEATFGCRSGATIITLVVGTGIGSSFLVEGVHLKGNNGWAGEVGVSPIGGVTPADVRAGGKALLKIRMGDISPEEMVKKVAENDPVALNAIKDAGKEFGYIIATLINIFNPEKLVIGGGCLRWPGYADAALEVAQGLTMEPLWKACEIQLPADPHLLVVRGTVRWLEAVL